VNGPRLGHSVCGISGVVRLPFTGIGAELLRAAEDRRQRASRGLIARANRLILDDLPGPQRHIERRRRLERRDDGNEQTSG